MAKHYYVYILSNTSHRSLYIGVTGNLAVRMHQHKNNAAPSFTRRYNINLLVYYEETTDVHAALAREKQLKNWHRDWKIDLIESTNPEWRDLSEE